MEESRREAAAHPVGGAAVWLGAGGSSKRSGSTWWSRAWSKAIDEWGEKGILLPIEGSARISRRCQDGAPKLGAHGTRGRRWSTLARRGRVTGVARSQCIMRVRGHCGHLAGRP
jgi:hypothetical protein